MSPKPWWCTSLIYVIRNVCIYRMYGVELAGSSLILCLWYVTPADVTLSKVLWISHRNHHNRQTIRSKRIRPQTERSPGLQSFRWQGLEHVFVRRRLKLVVASYTQRTRSRSVDAYRGCFKIVLACHMTPPGWLVYVSPSGRCLRRLAAGITSAMRTKKAVPPDSSQSTATKAITILLISDGRYIVI